MTVTTLFDQLIDQYKLERHLGQKRYTDVYQAYDVDLNRAVTVEVLQPLYANDADFADQYVARMRSISQIRHPNIAEILQVGISPSERPYVALDHVAGSPLSARLKQLERQNLPVHSIYALKLIRQIAEALNIADRLQIYHYDLRPENVLLKNITLKSNDSVVLADLGLPTPPKYQSNGAQPESYYSPEQLDKKQIDSRSHIYSLGIILFELLTGELPSETNTIWTQLFKFVTGKQSELAKKRPDLTPELISLVETCLQRDPRRRIQTIADFTTAVDNVLVAEELQIRTGSETIAAFPAPRQQFKRYLLLILLLFACGISGVAALRTSFFGIGGIVNINPTPTVTATILHDSVEETAVSADPSPTSSEQVVTQVEPTSHPPTQTFTPQPTATFTALPTATQTQEPSPTHTPLPTDVPPPLFHVLISSVSLR